MSTIPTIQTDTWKVKKATEIGEKMKQLLFSSGSLEITNKTRRQIKKMFNEQINLTDRMFQGIHTDGTEIGSTSNEDKEVEMLFQVLKKTPTLSFAKAKKTINNWMFKCSTDLGQTYPSRKHELIVKAYQKYEEEAKNKNIAVKTRGLDFVSKCQEYSHATSVDFVLEEQINKACEELKTLVFSSFNETYTFEDFAKSLVLVLDISGSMNGTPLQTGLFYLFMMVKVFGIDTVHYFESHHTEKKIVPGWSSNLDLIKQIYTHTQGSTELSSVFKFMNTKKTCDKNIVIITDGDCDPSDYHNPFHQVLDGVTYPNIKECNFIVVNVKETGLKFPYLNIDPRVCYLTGNNPKTLNGFIKALCEAVKSKLTITPDMILKYSLDIEELTLEYPVPTYSNVMSEERISELFEVFKKNLPPKKDEVAVAHQSPAIYSEEEVEQGVWGTY
jgi:hypothetical protein